MAGRAQITRSKFGAALLIALAHVAAGAAAQEVHFSPEERLDTIDAALIATAKLSIDFASYALTDPSVIAALNDAERRGVVVRIDPRERQEFRRPRRSLRQCEDQARRPVHAPEGLRDRREGSEDGLGELQHERRARTGQRPDRDPRPRRRRAVRRAL